MAEAEIRFPAGFESFGDASVRQKRAAKPICRITTSGFLSFNIPASSLMKMTGRQENIGCHLAFQPKNRVLAVKPVPYHLKPPRTYRLFPAGVGKNVFLVSFDRQSKAWGIPLDGRHCPCVWDDKNGMMLVFVDRVRKASDERGK